jgi:hypothetical protein
MSVSDIIDISDRCSCCDKEEYRLLTSGLYHDIMLKYIVYHVHIFIYICVYHEDQQ